MVGGQASLYSALHLTVLERLIYGPSAGYIESWKQPLDPDWRRLHRGEDMGRRHHVRHGGETRRVCSPSARWYEDGDHLSRPDQSRNCCLHATLRHL